MKKKNNKKERIPFIIPLLFILLSYVLFVTQCKKEEKFKAEIQSVKTEITPKEITPSIPVFKKVEVPIINDSFKRPPDLILFKKKIKTKKVKMGKK